MNQKERHQKALEKLATEHVKRMLDPKIRLREITEEGITLECEERWEDAYLTKELHILASWWGYAYGECEVSIETVKPDGFFCDTIKVATIHFKPVKPVKPVSA